MCSIKLPPLVQQPASHTAWGGTAIGSQVSLPWQQFQVVTVLHSAVNWVVMALVPRRVNIKICGRDLSRQQVGPWESSNQHCSCEHPAYKLYQTGSQDGFIAAKHQKNR